MRINQLNHIKERGKKSYPVIRTPLYNSPIIKLLPLTKTAWSQLGIPLKTSQISTTNDTGYFLIAAIKIKGMNNWGVRKS